MVAMRIAIGHLNHEVTIFSPLRTTLEDCRPIYFELGQGVLDLHRGRFTEVSGMIEAAEQEGVTLIPTLTAQALPGGPFTDETWAYLKGEILSRIAAAGDIDGVLLALHGAASTESLDCAEADLCAAVRRQIGPDLPLVVTFDLHGSVSTGTTDNVDALLGYKTCPHVDQAEIGARALRLLLDIKRRGYRPFTILEKIPMLTPYFDNTSHGPLGTLMDRGREMEQEPGIVAVSLFNSQVESGMRELGRSIVIVAEDEAARPWEKAQELRSLWWDLRFEFKNHRITTEQAIARMRQPGERPLMLIPRGDDPFSGGPGDGTFMLAAVLDNDIRNAVVACVPDGESVQRAVAAGVGNSVRLRIGGKLDSVHHRPLDIVAQVTCLTEGSHPLPLTHISQVDMGPAAAVRVGDTDIILTSNRTPAYDPPLFRRFGIDLATKRVLVLKSAGQAALWQELDPETVEVDSPGAFNSRCILDFIEREGIQLDYNYLTDPGAPQTGA
jgi:microcystin degradation protein MlrC